MIAPVEGSGDWPAWMARVARACCAPVERLRLIRNPRAKLCETGNCSSGDCRGDLTSHLRTLPAECSHVRERCGTLQIAGMRAFRPLVSPRAAADKSPHRRSNRADKSGPE